VVLMERHWNLEYIPPYNNLNDVFSLSATHRRFLVDVNIMNHDMSFLRGATTDLLPSALHIDRVPRPSCLDKKCAVRDSQD
jgi:hypothetical protein